MKEYLRISGIVIFLLAIPTAIFVVRFAPDPKANGLLSELHATFNVGDDVGDLEEMAQSPKYSEIRVVNRIEGTLYLFPRPTLGEHWNFTVQYSPQTRKITSLKIRESDGNTLPKTAPLDK